MLYVLGRGDVDALGLGKQLNPKPLSCILLSWVGKGQFEEGSWCKSQSSTMKIMIVVKDPKKKRHWFTWFAVSSITKEYWFLHYD
jgi:hypothetical protein